MSGSSESPVLNDLEIDELVDRLTPGEIQTFLEDCDPDDPDIPPSLRCNYSCDKPSTGLMDNKKLQDYLSAQALNTPDVPDIVPFISGTVRGKKWVEPKRSEPQNMKLDESITLDIDVDCDEALANASSAEIVDLAGILGLHSLMNQEQYHEIQSEKWDSKSDRNVAWNGVTKATPTRHYEDDAPNLTDPDDVIRTLTLKDAAVISKVNLNNLQIKEDQFMRLFDSLSSNDFLIELSLSNTNMGDFAALKLCEALTTNRKLQKLNIESNNISPQTLTKIFEAAAVRQVLTEFKASNQKAQFLGNKVEMAITHAIEMNKSLLKVGLHFEFSDCRNRVAVQLQRNLDAVRISRLSKITVDEASKFQRRVEKESR